MKDDQFRIYQSPPSRVFTTDIGQLSREKHYIRTLLEIDISDSLRALKAVRTNKNKLSFFSWFIKCIADTVPDHPPLNGIRRGKRTIFVPESVDISVVVEKDVKGQSVPLPLILRNAQEKSLVQLNDEIKSAVAQDVQHTGNLVLGSGENRIFMNLALWIPQKIRLLFMRHILKNPRRMQEIMGTVMVTSLATGGRVVGWIIPTSIHPLSIGVGTISKKTINLKGVLEKRDILHLTIAFDHDVIDGMPAKRFTEALVARLQSAYGLR